jgi:hypothetical protein
MAPSRITRRGMVGLVGGLSVQSAWAPVAAQKTDSDKDRTPAELAAAVTPVSFEYSELDPRRYGVDLTGSTDSHLAINSVLSIAEKYESAFVRFPANSMLRCDYGLTIDTNRVGIDWQGSTVNFTRMKSGHAIQFKQSELDVNRRPLRNITHPIMNGRFVGPGAHSDVGGALLSDSGGNLSGVKFRNIAFENFATDVILDKGAFCASFESCAFTQTAGMPASVYSVVVESRNNGERNAFVDCIWYNKAFHIAALSGNSDTYFSNCSFDTFITAFNVKGGLVFLDDCHIEGTGDTAAWGTVAPGAMLLVANTTIISQVDKTAFDIFVSAPGNTNGGVFLDRIFLELGSHVMTTRLIGGSGNARANNIVQPAHSARPVIGGMLNLLAYGGFEEAVYANDWSFSGAQLPSRTKSDAHSGSWSLQIPGSAATASNPSSASAKRACAPGQYLQGEMWLRIPAITGTGATFKYSVLYLDASDNHIGGSGNSVSVTANISSWSRMVLAAESPAPAGTVNAVVVLTMAGATSGAPKAFVDDVVVNIF